MEPNLLGLGRSRPQSPYMLDPRAEAMRPTWWLRLTSYGWDQNLRTLQERERMRRSRLLSWLLLGIFVVILLLLPLAFGDPGTLASELIVAVAGVVALALNRRGQVTAAGALLVVILCAAIMSSVASFPLGLTVDSLPVYDLLVIPVVVAASVLPRATAFLIAGLNILLIGLDFFLEQHADNLDAVIHDHRLYPSTSLAVVSLLARPIALQVITSLVAYLWVRGTDDAIRRADRAEEIARLEHQISDQRRQLEVGAQQILETHVRVANGDFAARAPVVQDNMLWQVAASLNNLLARLQKSAQSDHQLRRTEDELRRLAGAIDDAQAGRRPIWPAPTGTAADLIIERITGRSRQAQPAPLMGPPPQLSPQTSRHFPAQPPMSQSPWSPQMPPSAPSMPSQMPSQMPPSAPSTQGQMPATAPFGPGWVNSGPLAPGSPQQPNSQFSPQPNSQFSPQPNTQYPPQQPNAQRPQQGQEPAESAEPDNPWFAPPESQPPSW
jgi:hypothetical protein